MAQVFGFDSSGGLPSRLLRETALLEFSPPVREAVRDLEQTLVVGLRRLPGLRRGDWTPQEALAALAADLGQVSEVAARMAELQPDAEESRTARVIARMSSDLCAVLRGPSGTKGRKL